MRAACASGQANVHIHRVVEDVAQRSFLSTKSVGAIDLGQNPTDVILDLGCTNSVGSPYAVNKFMKAVLFLLEVPFFKRLRKYISIKEFFEMVPNLKLVEKKLGDIVFLDDTNVYMVINGRILLRYHEEDPLEF